MKLFPSHSTKDKELLRANSIDPWLCEKDIEYWVAKIEVALKESDLVRNSAMPGTAASRPRVTVLILCTRAATLPHRSTTTIASLWRGGSRWSSGSVIRSAAGTMASIRFSASGVGGHPRCFRLPYPAGPVEVPSPFIHRRYPTGFLAEVLIRQAKGSVG